MREANGLGVKPARTRRMKSEETWVCIPALTLTSIVASRKFLNVSRPCFLICEMGGFKKEYYPGGNHRTKPPNMVEIDGMNLLVTRIYSEVKIE